MDVATVTHNEGCQRDSCTFRCKAFGIALSKVYASSFGVGVSIPVRSDSRGGSNTRHCSVVLQETGDHVAHVDDGVDGYICIARHRHHCGRGAAAWRGMKCSESIAQQEGNRATVQRHPTCASSIL